MKSLLVLLLLGMLGSTQPPASQTVESQPATSPGRFVAVDVFIDAGAKSLAAYQFELKAPGPDVALLGVEGVPDSGFNDPPYYDTRAALNRRIVIAAFNTGSALPSGKTRVATLHLRIAGPGEPQYAATLQVAADADAKAIPATISVAEGATR